MAEKEIVIEEKTTEEKNTAETKEVKEETPLEDVVLETEGGTKSLLGATSGTDIAATSLDTKTTPAGTDNLILFNQNTNVGYQIDYDNLADAILNKITSKTYTNQVGGSSAATLLAQLSTLNSNFPAIANLLPIADQPSAVQYLNGGFILMKRIAFVTVSFKPTTDLTSGSTKRGRLPAPLVPCVFPIVSLSTGQQVAWCYVTENGDLYFYGGNLNANTTYTITGCFMRAYE